MLHIVLFCFVISSLSISAEIVSATGFEGDKIYICYQVQVPDGWKVRTGNLVDGIAEEDLRNAGKATAGKKGAGNKRWKRRFGHGGGAGDVGGAHSVANAVLDALAMDGFADGIDAEGMLNGI